MNWINFWEIVSPLLTPITAVIGVLFVGYASYQKLRHDVAALIAKVSPQAKEIAELNLKMALVQRDVAEMKSDLRMVRRHQQAAANNDPEKGALPEMKIEKRD